MDAGSGAVLTGPNGIVLDIPPAALDRDTTVSVSASVYGRNLPAESPFQAVGEEYEVSLGSVSPIGKVTLSIPLGGQGGAARTLPDRLYVARTYNALGTPELIGAEETDGRVVFPIPADGPYQVFFILPPDLSFALSPLQVPQYPQRTQAWCVPTALTDVAQFHVGSWPAGGLGSAWGETSNWYLAGKNGQPPDMGTWFHEVLSAGGFSAPEDVFQSFSSSELEVLIWHWGQPGWGVEEAEALWQAYRAYVESTLWGSTRSPRPVAYASSIEEHSKVLTGSSGGTLYINEPGTGGSNTGVNIPSNWETHHQLVLSLAEQAAEAAATPTALPTLEASGGGGISGPFEVIATMVLLSDPRPEVERRGVLWLTPATPSQPGAVALRRGPAHTIAAGWNWDGAGQHDLGYFYDDRLGGLPADPILDHAFTYLGPQDDLLLTYSVVNIDDKPRTYHVAGFLLPEGGGTSAIFSHDVAGPIAPGEAAFDLQATLPLAGLPPGQHVLKFVLSLEDVVQDTKFVTFRLAPAPAAFSTPVLSTPVFYSGPDSCGPTKITFELTTHVPGAQGMLLAYRLWDVARDQATGWTVEAMNPLGQGSFRRALQAGKDIRGLDDVERGWMQYQFIVTGADGQALARTQVYGDLAFAPCGGGLPPLRLITPTPVIVR